VPKVLFVAEGEALADALRAEQLEVLEVPDVDQAFMVAGAFRPDAIVLGLSQRTNAGLLSAVMLRLDAVTARTPLICLLDAETEAAAALAVGCALALPRSISGGELAKSVDQLVESRLGGEAPRS